MSKTFRTVGSGSQQTLHQIEDEKIPVYATQADLEADLANLEEGQIVATEDGGGDEQTLMEYVDGRLETTTTEISMDAFKTGSKAQLYKSGNNVQFRYFVADNTAFNPIADATWTTIATIPEGLRPKSTIYLAMQGSFGGKVGSVQIKNTGEVQVYKFTGENFGWEFSIQCDYNVDGTNSHAMSVHTLQEAKNYTDDKAVIRHDYTITGTTDVIADTQALVNHILTLGKGTYAGEFKRQGATFGNYELTYFIDGDGTKSVLGLVNYGVALSNQDQTYQVSYLLEVGSSTPSWVVRPISNIFSSGSFSNLAMNTVWDQAQQADTLRIGYLPYNDTRNPTYTEQQSYGIAAQNVEVHAGYYTVIGYSFDGRVFTYDKVNGWQNTTARDIQKWDIEVPGPSTPPANAYDALLYQLQNANWTYLVAKNGRVCTGTFILSGNYWGRYTAIHHGSNYVTVTGTIDYAGQPYTFSAFRDALVSEWKVCITGQTVDIPNTLVTLDANSCFRMGAIGVPDGRSEVLSVHAWTTDAQGQVTGDYLCIPSQNFYSQWYCRVEGWGGGLIPGQVVWIWARYRLA